MGALRGGTTAQAVVVTLSRSRPPRAVQVRAQLEREVAAAAGELVSVHEATRVATEAKQEAQAQVGGQYQRPHTCVRGQAGAAVRRRDRGGPLVLSYVCVGAPVRAHKCVRGQAGARDSVTSCRSVCCRPGPRVELSSVLAENVACARAPTGGKVVCLHTPFSLAVPLLVQAAALRVAEDAEAAAFEVEVKELAACSAADEKLLQVGQ